MINKILHSLNHLWLTNKVKAGTESYTYPMQIRSEKPFYIVSPGRTGSTLLRKMLMAGNDVHIPPESDELIPNIIKDHLKHRKLSWRMQVDELVALYSRSELEELWKISPEHYKEHLLQTPLHQQNLYSKTWALHQVHASAAGAHEVILGDKTPLLSEWIDWLNIVSPNARYILILRNLYDTVASRKKAFNESIDEAFLRYQYSWEKVHQFDTSDSGMVHTCFYEELVTSPEDQMREISRFLNIPYRHSMLEPQNIQVADESLSHHAELKKALQKSAIGKGQRELSEAEIHKLQVKGRKIGLPERVLSIQTILS